MTNTHPVVPSSDQIGQWIIQSDEPGKDVCEGVAILAAQWGADVELEACAYRQFVIYGKRASDELLAARRPKPPSLKEQALADFNWLIGRTVGNPKADARSKRLLQALEALPDD